jgi:Suppressor of fused protein (SUFU)
MAAWIGSCSRGRSGRKRAQSVIDLRLMDEVSSQLRAHVDAWFRASVREEFSWTLGPMSQAFPRFRVARYAPPTGNDPWLYVTFGASEVQPDGERTEFFLLSPVETPRHVESLAMVAYFHADPTYGVTEGKILDIGRPWLEGSDADHLLASKPLPYAPDFEWCRTGAGDVRFLWLVPITRAEAAFARQHGVEALEDALEDSGVDVMDAERPAVV